MAVGAGIAGTDQVGVLAGAGAGTIGTILITAVGTTGMEVTTTITTLMPTEEEATTPTTALEETIITEAILQQEATEAIMHTTLREEGKELIIPTEIQQDITQPEPVATVLQIQETIIQAQEIITQHETVIIPQEITATITVLQAEAILQEAKMWHHQDHHTAALAQVAAEDHQVEVPMAAAEDLAAVAADEEDNT